MKPIMFFEAQKKILDELFEENWFQRNAKRKINHPAMLSWNLCVKLIFQNGIVKWPEDIHNLPLIADIILNNYSLLECSDGDINNLRLGSFSNYGDSAVRRRIYSVIDKDIHFASLLTELSYAAWHISKGHNVTAFESEGLPDFQVCNYGGSLPIVTDCKRIFKDTNKSRLAKIITKANKQIKKLDIDCYGVGVIDITDKIAQTDDFSDSIPETVIEISNIIKKSIQIQNTSISAILLLWSDYILHGRPGESPTSLFAYRKRSYTIEHQHPKHKLPENFSLFDFGNTITYRITWNTRNN